jgi:hypothetical protein
MAAISDCHAARLIFQGSSAQIAADYGHKRTAEGSGVVPRRSSDCARRQAQPGWPKAAQEAADALAPTSFTWNTVPAGITEPDIRAKSLIETGHPWHLTQSTCHNTIA